MHIIMLLPYPNANVLCSVIIKLYSRNDAPGQHIQSSLAITKEDIVNDVDHVCEYLCK